MPISANLKREMLILLCATNTTSMFHLQHLIGKLPKRTRSLTPLALQPPQLYTNPIPVSNALKKDLVKLCNHKVIKTQLVLFESKYQ